MTKIYKYPLLDQPAQVLLLPRGAEILHVAYQRFALCLWAVVNPDEPQTEARQIEIVGTGQQFNRTGARHLATVLQPPHAEYVWHIFERFDLTAPAK